MVSDAVEVYVAEYAASSAYLEVLKWITEASGQNLEFLHEDLKLSSDLMPRISKEAEEYLNEILPLIETLKIEELRELVNLNRYVNTFRPRKFSTTRRI